MPVVFPATAITLSNSWCLAGPPLGAVHLRCRCVPVRRKPVPCGRGSSGRGKLPQGVPGLDTRAGVGVGAVVEGEHDGGEAHPLLLTGADPLTRPIRKRLSAHSELELLERTAEGDRLQVTITTGRPHQIRIHLAQLGSPLLGDPLYLFQGEVSAQATPGDGGYRLHAWRLKTEGLALQCSLSPDWGIV